jgi:hypothetical protein
VKRWFLVAAVGFAAASGVTGCSGDKSESATTTTVARQPTLADYAPKVAELQSLGRVCDMALAIADPKSCVEATNEKISITNQVEPLLRQIPRSKTVDGALVQTQGLLQAGSGWTSKGCGLVANGRELARTKCFADAMTVSIFFEGLSKSINSLGQG